MQMEVSSKGKKPRRASNLVQKSTSSHQEAFARIPPRFSLQSHHFPAQNSMLRKTLQLKPILTSLQLESTCQGSFHLRQQQHRKPDHSGEGCGLSAAAEDCVTRSPFQSYVHGNVHVSLQKAESAYTGTASVRSSKQHPYLGNLTRAACLEVSYLSSSPANPSRILKVFSSWEEIWAGFGS